MVGIAVTSGPNRLKPEKETAGQADDTKDYTRRLIHSPLSFQNENSAVKTAEQAETGGQGSEWLEPMAES
jgi:hypothetical protein